jgi:hypothetical protein
MAKKSMDISTIFFQKIAHITLFLVKLLQQKKCQYIISLLLLIPAMDIISYFWLCMFSKELGESKLQEWSFKKCLGRKIKYFQNSD